MRPSRVYSPAPINTRHELATGLVGAWINLPELEGRAWDVSGRGFHATPTNGPTNSTDEQDFAAAKTTSATGEYFDCGNASALNLVSGGWMACSAIFTSLTVVGGTTAWLIGRDDNTLGRAYAFGVVNDGRLTLQINGAGKATGTRNIVSVGPPQWQRFFCAGGVNSGWRIYCNGALEASGTWTAPNTTTGSTTLCRRTFSGSEGKFTATVGSFLMSTNAPVSAQHADHLAALDFDEWKRGWPTFYTVIPTKETAWLKAPATTAPGYGTSDGLSVATGIGNLVSRGQGSADGTCTATTTANARASGFGTAAGTGSTTGAGGAASEGYAQGNGDGTSTAGGVGNALADGFGSANGSGTAAATSIGNSLGSGTASGTCTAVGVGPVLPDGIGSSAGTSTCGGRGESLASGWGSADGSSFGEASAPVSHAASCPKKTMTGVGY